MFQKSVAGDQRHSTAKANTVKRRINDGSEKRRKKCKEPRPHPSYRLNKRYWDDIRAGRRSHNIPLEQSPPQRTTPIHPPNPIGLAPFSTPVSHLSPSLISALASPTLVSPPYMSYPFPSVSSSSLFTSSSLTSRTQLKTEPEDIIDVTSCDDDDVKLCISSKEKPERCIQMSRPQQRESDAVVDRLADEMFEESVMNGNDKKCAVSNATHDGSAHIFMPIPVPIPVPVLIPLSEAFILKHFAHATRL
ncbi:unnamed protein product [Toxocara canis]|uniref:Uncharacterized protein n=1 Tax=Toxocara canis TaxID=6265 RepID=A0A183V115_TOXCA|nr:unnamed protein product [Toxocara canis]